MFKLYLREFGEDEARRLAAYHDLALYEGEIDELCEDYETGIVYREMRYKHYYLPEKPLTIVAMKKAAKA